MSMSSLSGVAGRAISPSASRFLVGMGPARKVSGSTGVSDKSVEMCYGMLKLNVGKGVFDLLDGVRIVRVCVGEAFGGGEGVLLVGDMLCFESIACDAPLRARSSCVLPIWSSVLRASSRSNEYSHADIHASFAVRAAHTSSASSYDNFAPCATLKAFVSWISFSCSL